MVKVGGLDTWRSKAWSSVAAPRDFYIYQGRLMAVSTHAKCRCGACHQPGTPGSYGRELQTRRVGAPVCHRGRPGRQSAQAARAAAAGRAAASLSPARRRRSLRCAATGTSSRVCDASLPPRAPGRSRQPLPPTPSGFPRTRTVRPKSTRDGRAAVSEALKHVRVPPQHVIAALTVCCRNFPGVGLGRPVLGACRQHVNVNVNVNN